ncbi:MAG: hypothetical protein U0359_01620 [Byssovorax sp.]
MLVSDRLHIGNLFLPNGAALKLKFGATFARERAEDPVVEKRVHVSPSVPQLVAEVIRPGRSLDFCLTSFGDPLAREPLARAMVEIVGSDLQCLPVRVGDDKEFSLLNAIRLVQCFDEERSEFLKWTERDNRPDKLGEYRMVTRLRLDARKIPPDAHVFRVELWPVALIVSEVVKATMEHVGCSGAKFREVTGAEELS